MRKWEVAEKDVFWSKTKRLEKRFIFTRTTLRVPQLTRNVFRRLLKESKISECVSMTPLAIPVVPLVRMRVARASGPEGQMGCAFRRPKLCTNRRILHLQPNITSIYLSHNGKLFHRKLVLLLILKFKVVRKLIINMKTSSFFSKAVVIPTFRVIFFRGNLDVKTFEDDYAQWKKVASRSFYLDLRCGEDFESKTLNLHDAIGRQLVDGDQSAKTQRELAILS